MKIDIILKKPRSRTYIHFKNDDYDDWFILIKHIEKSGKVNREHIVTQGRYNDWLESYINDGWVIQKEK